MIFTTLLVSTPPIKTILSQPPHVFLNPTTCQGGCLRLPYVHHYNAFDGPAGEHLNTGFIALTDLVGLKQLSPTIDTVTLTVMCWAENVVLSAPTTTNLPGIVPQSGDEYGDNAVSNTMIALSKVAGVLSKILPIRPYALASQEILNRAARVAIAMGFSKPAIVSPMDYMVPRVVPNFSSAIQHDPIYKLAYDDKQEVTHDPSVCGLSRVDEMSLLTLMQRPALISSLEWKTADLPEKVLMNFKVTPSHYSEATGPPSLKLLGFSPMCYLTQMFRQWRGSIRFRFVAVASSFHRGRIRISYDPEGITTAQLAAGIEHNTQYSYIWDLNENHEAVIDVGYMSNQSYCRPLKPGETAVADMRAPTQIPRNASFDNGTLTLTVMNDLTANGVADATISILFFCSAGPDFEVYDPTDGIENYTLMPQSGEMMEDDLMMSAAIKPHVVFGTYISERDKATLVHHGDPVTSLRYMLKRYTAYMTLPLTAIPINGVVAHDINISAFPLQKGKAPGAIHTALGAPYNYVFQTPLNWASSMFMMRRGGVRLRIRDTSPAFLTMSELKAIRNTSSTASNAVATLLGPSLTFSAQAKFNLTALPSSGAAGMALGTSLENGKNQVDVEVPFHSQRRYFSPRLRDNSLNHNQGLKIQAVVYNPGTVVRSGQLSIYTSAADDFSLSGFVSCPPVYYNPLLL